MAWVDISRKDFLRLCAGAAAFGVTGCDSGDGGGAGTDSASGSSSGTSGGGTTGSPDPSSTSSSPTTTDDSTTGSTGAVGESSSGSGGESSSGSSTGEAGSSSSGGPQLQCQRGAEATEVDLHPHGLSIAADQLQPGTPLMGLTMTGNHPHTVDLTADEVDALLAGQPITVNNVDAGHTHEITIGCV